MGENIGSRTGRTGGGLGQSSSGHGVDFYGGDNPDDYGKIAVRVAVLLKKMQRK